MEVRRRTTLSDQLSAAAAVRLPSSASKLTTSSSSLNLRDLLKVRQEEDLQQPQQQQVYSRRSASISLGTFLACEKRELTAVTAAAATAGGRTLLDIIRDEEEDSGRSGNRVSWRAFRERLQIRRAGDPPNGNGIMAAGVLVLPSPAAAVASPRVPVPDNNLAHVVEHTPAAAAVSNSGASTPPTDPRPPPLTRTATFRLQLNGPVSEGEQAPPNRGGPPPATAGEAEQQVRVSLMALLEQTDRQGGGSGFAVSALLEEEAEEEEEGEEEEAEERGEKNHFPKCCVCMVRHRGAAFIPCGHTFCRLCCRELWVTRGHCPLCNGFILEILDIF